MIVRCTVPECEICRTFTDTISAVCGLCGTHINVLDMPNQTNPHRCNVVNCVQCKGRYDADTYRIAPAHTPDTWTVTTKCPICDGHNDIDPKRRIYKLPPGTTLGELMATVTGRMSNATETKHASGERATIR